MSGKKLKPKAKKSNETYQKMSKEVIDIVKILRKMDKKDTVPLFTLIEDIYWEVIYENPKSLDDTISLKGWDNGDYMDVTYNAGRKTSKLRPPNTIDGEALQDTLEDYYDPNTHTVTTYVNGNRITRSTDSKGNITTTTEPINKEVTKYEPPKDLVKRMNGNNLRDIYLVLSNKVTAKLLQLMKEIQDIEWGSYIVYKTQIPNDPMWEITEDNQEPIEIIIEDLVLIPQKISSGHVEFMEIEYPELMKDLIEYKFSGYFTTGRLHSHHTLGAFHSGTDLGEFEKYFSAGDKLLSIVASFKNHQAKQTFKNTDLKAPNSVELLMSCLDFHSMIGIPEVSIFFTLHNH